MSTKVKLVCLFVVLALALVSFAAIAVGSGSLVASSSHSPSTIIADGGDGGPDIQGHCVVSSCGLQGT